MKVGVLGLGYWGPNLVRNFIANNKISDVIGCEKNKDRLNVVGKRFPGIELCTEVDSLLFSRFGYFSNCNAG